jgi:hypothetical protein
MSPSNANPGAGGARVHENFGGATTSVPKHTPAAFGEGGV